jgi:phenylpropionate dioxygenase-like ring-hydroxylating dioxygenase large terminal subunit
MTDRDVTDFLKAPPPATTGEAAKAATLVGLPMPRNPELVTDAGRRVKVMRQRGRRFPFPVPNGWFVVAEAKDLLPGEVRSLYLFGRDLVLYRTDSGEPRMVDAHCPHLGAHLGVGGKVEGECLRCPFHGWSFGPDGQCVDIPYSDSPHIPSKAHARSYPTLERNQMIWAWHHAEEGEPFYDVPEVEELSSDEWTDYDIREFEIAIACQEMAENNVDFAHFRYVHGTDAIPEDEFHVDGTYKRTVGQGGNFVREGYGLGLGVLRIKDWVTFVSSTTPIDEENVKVRWIFTSPVANGPDAARQAAAQFSAGVSQDLPIWENKRYVERPVVTKSEKKLLEQRQWARQFYSNYDG